MLSQSQANFFINRPISISHPLLREVFKNNSYEIFQFLEKEDIQSLKLVNKYFLDVCDCHELLDSSMKSLSQLFVQTVKVEDNGHKKSKLKEKFNYNKPVGEYYKPEEGYKRIESGKKKK